MSSSPLPRATFCALTLLLGLAGVGAAEEDWVAPSRRACRKRLCEQTTLFSWSIEGDDEDGEKKPDLEEEEFMISDRPDFTDSPVAVGKGHFQIETGYTQTSSHHDDERSRTDSYPEILLRAGVLAEWLELRIGLNYSRASVTSTDSESAARGFNDLYVACKIALTEQAGWLPAMSITPSTTLPTGSQEMSADMPLPGLGCSYAWEITDNFCLGGGTMLSRAVSEDGTRYLELAESVSASFSVTEQTSVFAEWYAFFPTTTVDEEPQHYFDTGLLYLITPKFQVDGRVGFGLNDAADDFYWGTGLSYRY